VEEIAAVWHERRPETDLRQRIIESIKESTHVASAA
jgi:hypothetical protein